MIKGGIITELNKFKRIGVAVSGGADSMALLHYLYYRDYNVIVVNVEHGIRGERSAEDTEFVRSFCDSLSIPCKVFRVDSLSYAKERGMTVEQAARELRHEIFLKFALKHGIPIATAHHRSDQAESVFMHIARGTGPDGLVGMTFRDGHLIRPLIDTDKEQITEYIAANEVPHVEDETNNDENYSRNYVRNTIFPAIGARYPSFKDNLVKLSKRASELKRVIDRYTPELAEDYGALVIDTAGAERILAANAVMKACDALGADCDIEERHIEAVLSLKANKRLDLPRGVTVYNEYGRLAFVKEGGAPKPEYALKEGRFGWGFGELEVVVSDRPLDGYKHIDSDKATAAGARVRTRRDGDKIALEYGRKSLGDVFTDKKIPQRLRDSVPVIAGEGGVIAIADIEVSPDYRIGVSTERILNIRWVK